MEIKTLSDIIENPYKFVFRYEVPAPDAGLVLDGKVKIWITSEGVVIGGRKSYGKIGNGMFVFECSGCFLLCKWEDITEYVPRNMECIKIAVYPNTVYPYKIGERVVRGHIEVAAKYREEIMNMEGKGVKREVLDALLNKGEVYQDGKDMFFLKRSLGKFWFKRVMSAEEFRKVVESKQIKPVYYYGN